MKPPLFLPVVVTAMLLIGFAVAPAGAESSTGRIEGRVTASDGRPLGGVSVVIHETGQSTLTDRSGRYRFDRVAAPGVYSLVFVQGSSQPETLAGVTVKGDALVTVDLQTEWEYSFTESLVVYSASRREERIVEAPAAVTVINEEQIEREASHGQLPKLLEFTPGVEATQSGIYDFNFNTRGFNSSLNRRVATLIDGRNPSVPFLGAQEWAAVSFPLDDLASAELVRGPSAALYGANASSGVLNLSTRQPRYSEGGLIRFTGGELSTTNVDFRWAGELKNDWYLKATGGTRLTGDFTVSRAGAAEYSVPCPVPQGGATDCLPQEALPLDPLNDDEIYFGSLRLDKHMAGGGTLTLEGGTADIRGPVFQTGIGRVQVVEADRPWARANFSMDHWNFLAYYTGRDAPRQTALGLGRNIALDTSMVMAEVQTNWDFADERLRLVAGGAIGRDEIDSLDPATGMQTLIFEPVENDKTALFWQLDWQATESVKAVVALRYDNADLHDAQYSPKASIVWQVAPDYTLRFTYNQAFQVANYSEFFLQADVAPPADLSALNGICLLEGVTDCGFDLPARVLALGNPTLDVEETEAFEIGYSAILGRKAFLTADYYRTQNEQFITDLIPQLGTALAPANPNFGLWEYAGTQGLSAGAVATIRALAAGALPATSQLSNNLDGSNIVAAVAYTNFGEVDTQGFEFGLNYFFSDRVSGQVSATWFDFELEQSSPGLDALLLPNTPEYSVSARLAYAHGPLDWSIAGRRVDKFRWVVGPFQGFVEAYTVVDLGGNYALGDQWKIGALVSNALNNKHWESFGGDLLERRTLVNVTFGWD